MANTGKKIVQVGQRFNGQREIPPNQGFEDSDFERLMRAVGGWKKSYSWCCCFTRLVWITAFNELKLSTKAIEKNFTPGVLETYRRFGEDKAFTVSREPVVGALAVWRNGRSQFGHIGIVTQVNGERFQCLEGNTNSEGGREGIEVAIRPRRLDFAKKAKGLYLLGFVHPPSDAKPVEKAVVPAPQKPVEKAKAEEPPEVSPDAIEKAVEAIKKAILTGAGGTAAAAGGAEVATGHSYLTDWRVWAIVATMLLLGNIVQGIQLYLKRKQ